MKRHGTQRQNAHRRVNFSEESHVTCTVRPFAGVSCRVGYVFDSLRVTEQKKCPVAKLDFGLWTYDWEMAVTLADE